MWDLSSPTRDRTCVPCIGRWILYHWATREVPKVHRLLRHDFCFQTHVTYLGSNDLPTKYSRFEDVFPLCAGTSHLYLFPIGSCFSKKKVLNNNSPWASLVAQWLRICLLMKGTRVRALVWEDPTCRGATRPVSHNY